MSYALLSEGTNQNGYFWNRWSSSTRSKWKVPNIKSRITYHVVNKSSECYTHNEFNPAGTVIASGSHDKQIFSLERIWGMREFHGFEKGHKNVVLDLQWTTDGSQIISAIPDKTLQAWDVETGKQKKKYGRTLLFCESMLSFP
ncbi:hypothetical protein ACSBR2_029422 [Camellia fascicularis]